jgi:hypothetical protein
MAALAVIAPVFVNFRMALCIAMPLIPGSPVALIAIPVSFMDVMTVATVLLVGVFAVSMMLAVFVASVMVIVTISAVTLIIPVPAMIDSFLLVSMALLVLLRIVTVPMPRVVIPAAGKGNTSEAKDDNGNNAKDVRLFHCFPPSDPD